VDAHRRDSRRQRERVPARLRAFGALPSPDGRAGARILAAARGFAGGRADLTEERLAERGGDDATARVAREARADDQELARRLLRPRGASTPPEECAP
jgi:hypothetical protein